MTTLELYSTGEPELTVALPMRNSKDISFLAFESLLNQRSINFDWELIVYEEQHDNMTDPDVIREYAEKMKSVGCTRFVWITQADQPLLIDKWIEIANISSDSSKSFVLQAADCYSYSFRLANTHQTINVSEFKWFDNYNGLFYSINSKRIVQYGYNMLTNLSMALDTNLMRKVKSKKIYKGIDGYIYHQAKLKCRTPFYEYSDPTLHMDGLDTHGHNNISVNRESFFNNIRIPFKETDVTLDNTLLPKNVIKRLKAL